MTQGYQCFLTVNVLSAYLLPDPRAHDIISCVLLVLSSQTGNIQTGDMLGQISDLHDAYGDTIRIARATLSCADSWAWGGKRAKLVLLEKVGMRNC